MDAERVRAAIEAAERRTSGEIRVSVSRYFWGDLRAAAELAFERLRMHETSGTQRRPHLRRSVAKALRRPR